MIRTPAKMGIALGLLSSLAFGQSSAPATGTIQGVVFTVDTDGALSVLPAAEISLDGATHIETQSNHEGKFVLSAIPAGSYAITGQAPGIAATEEHSRYPRDGLGSRAGNESPSGCRINHCDRQPRTCFPVCGDSTAPLWASRNSRG